VPEGALTLLDAEALRQALTPVPTAGRAPCTHCAHLQCKGWESITAPLGPPLLQAVGTLRDPSIDEPTLTERHLPGTHYWHASAPVAVLHFPYNRCTAWRCPACGRGFVQHTETGGYYVDHRIRAVDVDLISD
jgi:hypothetical protein